MMADLIAEALQVGLRVLRLLASPETCGQAMEVPEIML